jgi:uncharacterized protein (TIGR02466 family)
MADRTSAGGSNSGDAPELTIVNLFPTPILVATIPDAESLNVELKRIILAREAERETVERSNQGGWQSSWDLHQWGGAPVQRVLGFARSVIDEATVDRAGNHRQIDWRFNCWANVNRSGHGNQFHTHPGAFWSASYYVEDGGIGSDASLGGEFEVQDPRGVATVMYAPQLTFAGPDGPSLGEAQRFRPKAGMLFVFPSWLQHGVRPYKGQRERISIAINFSVAAG